MTIKQYSNLKLYRTGLGIKEYPILSGWSNLNSPLNVNNKFRAYMDSKKVYEVKNANPQKAESHNSVNLRNQDILNLGDFDMLSFTNPFLSSGIQYSRVSRVERISDTTITVYYDIDYIASNYGDVMLNESSATITRSSRNSGFQETIGDLDTRKLTDKKILLGNNPENFDNIAKNDLDISWIVLYATRDIRIAPPSKLKAWFDQFFNKFTPKKGGPGNSGLIHDYPSALYAYGFPYDRKTKRPYMGITASGTPFTTSFLDVQSVMNAIFIQKEVQKYVVGFEIKPYILGTYKELIGNNASKSVFLPAKSETLQLNPSKDFYTSHPLISQEASYGMFAGIGGRGLALPLIQPSGTLNSAPLNDGFVGVKRNINNMERLTKTLFTDNIVKDIGPLIKDGGFDPNKNFPNTYYTLENATGSEFIIETEKLPGGYLSIELIQDISKDEQDFAAVLDYKQKKSHNRLVNGRQQQLIIGSYYISNDSRIDSRRVNIKNGLSIGANFSLDYITSSDAFDMAEMANLVSSATGVATSVMTAVASPLPSTVGGAAATSLNFASEYMTAEGLSGHQYHSSSSKQVLNVSSGRFTLNKYEISDNSMKQNINYWKEHGYIANKSFTDQNIIRNIEFGDDGNRAILRLSNLTFSKTKLHKYDVEGIIAQVEQGIVFKRV